MSDLLFEWGAECKQGAEWRLAHAIARGGSHPWYLHRVSANVSPSPIVNVHRSATRDDETRHLIDLYQGDADKIMNRIEGQLVMLSGRAQTLLSLAGITITVTGFSGASIARSGRPAAVLLVSGLVLVLIAASLAMRGILAVRWTTAIGPCPLEQAIHAALDVRDAKTRAFSRSLGILILGLSLYVGSVAWLLLVNLPD